jgi:hypothetical protein
MAGSDDMRMSITPGGQVGRSFGAAQTDRHSFACRSRGAVETHLRALSALNDKARPLCSDDEASGVWTIVMRATSAGIVGSGCKKRAATPIAW